MTGLYFSTILKTYNKALGLKDRLKDMTEEEQLTLLATDGMLVKRPILVDGERVLVGFHPEEWEKQ